MAHGFRFQAGPSSSDVVEITSTDVHTGVLLESFQVDYVSGTSVSRTYSSFPGTTLYVLMTGVQSGTSYYSPSQTFSVNNSTKTVTVYNGSGLGSWAAGSVFVTVLGF
jgi:hypothetical protein